MRSKATSALASRCCGTPHSQCHDLPGSFVTVRPPRCGTMASYQRSARERILPLRQNARPLARGDIIASMQGGRAMATRAATSRSDNPTPVPRELRGVVERITYQNPDNGYTVARLAPERSGPEAGAAAGDDRLVTVVGTLADLTPGEAIVARGRWRNDPKHGWQFRAVDYRTALPAGLQGMKEYVGS